VKTLNKILSVFLVAIFIVSSTGILIYKTHCLCTGTEQVGIYLKPETCEDDFHIHHTHDSAGNEENSSENCCHECSPKKHDCGCNSPEIRFFKLTNDITQDNNTTSFERVSNLTIKDVVLIASLCFEEPALSVNAEKPFTDTPPKIKSSKKLLIQINQLKIPHSA
jgi:hypothetical protein